MAQVPGKITTLEGEAPKVVTVVLTGGPCAGKSSCLSGLRREATLRGFNVLVVPEVATVIMNSGFLPDSGTATKFQKHIVLLQKQLDASFLALAKATYTPTLIIFDRGLMDGKAYAEEEAWNNILSKVKADKTGSALTEQYMLDSYDMVVHLVTAADGAEQFYKHGFTTDDSGNSVYRGEGPERAREVDRVLRHVWEKHPRHVVVENTDGGMKAKAQKVIDEVMSLCDHFHPQTKERTTKELRSRAHELEQEILRLQKRLTQLETKAPK